MSLYMHTRIHAYIHAYTYNSLLHALIHSYVHVIFTFILICMHTYARAYINTRKHTQTHIHVHTCMQSYLHTFTQNMNCPRRSACTSDRGLVLKFTRHSHTYTHITADIHEHEPIRMEHRPALRQGREPAAHNSADTPPNVRGLVSYIHTAWLGS